MDGSSKFVKGDAVAAMLILAANVIGGLILGPGEPRPHRQRRGEDLYPARDRRRAGRAAAQPDAVDRRGGDRHPRIVGQGPRGPDRPPICRLSDLDAGRRHPDPAGYAARHAALRAAAVRRGVGFRGLEAQPDRAPPRAGRAGRSRRAGRCLAHRLGRGDRGHAGPHRHRLWPGAARRRAPGRAADEPDHRRPASAVQGARLRRAAGEGARRHRARALHLPPDRQRRRASARIR